MVRERVYERGSTREGLRERVYERGSTREELHFGITGALGG